MNVTTEVGTTARERYGPALLESRTARDRLMTGMVDSWMDIDLDYVITLSFSERIYLQHGLKNPERLKNFTLDRMAEAEYFGPYVLVVHDNCGTTYWHPHLIVKESDGTRRLEHLLWDFGDLGKEYNGPIRGAGTFVYHAIRATESGLDLDNCEYNPRWRRRSRPRGHGGKLATCSPL